MIRRVETKQPQLANSPEQEANETFEEHVAEYGDTRDQDRADAEARQKSADQALDEADDPNF